MRYLKFKLERIRFKNLKLNITGSLWILCDLWFEHKFNFRNDTKAIIGELKAFTLYRFKVRMLQKDLNSSQFSESIECYTSEDGE